jgi:O-antigen/teichoic acid export membrane protein
MVSNLLYVRRWLLWLHAMSLKRNTLWNLAGGGLPLVAALAFIPFVLNRLGNELFGILTLIWALIGYFSLFDMGVGRALTYELSRLRGTNNEVAITPTLVAGLLLTIVTGIIGGVALFVFSLYATQWLNISPYLQADVQLTFQIAALGVVPTTLTSGLRGALEGLGRFASSNVNKIIFGFCVFALPAFSVWMHGAQLWLITLYLLLARVVITVLASISLREYLFTKFKNQLNITRYGRPLLNYGVWVTITGVVGPLMIYGDRFFVGAAVGASQLPLYAIPQEGLQRLLIIPAALTGARNSTFVCGQLQEGDYRYVYFVLWCSGLRIPNTILVAITRICCAGTTYRAHPECRGMA